MSDKENYFPSGASIDEINDTLYTDHGFLRHLSSVEVENINKQYKHITEEESSLEPPF